MLQTKKTKVFIPVLHGHIKSAARCNEACLFSHLARCCMKLVILLDCQFQKITKIVAHNVGKLRVRGVTDAVQSSALSLKHTDSYRIQKNVILELDVCPRQIQGNALISCFSMRMHYSQASSFYPPPLSAEVAWILHKQFHSTVILTLRSLCHPSAIISVSEIPLPPPPPLLTSLLVANFVSLLFGAEQVVYFGCIRAFSLLLLLNVNVSCETEPSH